jgi:hypothetical protein
MDYKQETDGDDESIGENLLSNTPDMVQSIQKRRQLVIESSDESDARTGDDDGGDNDIRVDGRMGIDDSSPSTNPTISSAPSLPAPAMMHIHAEFLSVTKG